MNSSPLDLAKDHHRAGRLDLAEPLYRQILAAQPDQPDALYGLSLIYASRGDPNEAIALIQRAVAQAPNRPDYQYNLAVLLRTLNRRREAIDAFRKALAVRPDFLEALFNLAVTLEAEGNSHEAIDTYRRSIEFHPDHAASHINLGNALMASGNSTDALPALECACDLRPEIPEAHFNRGNALRNLERHREAIQAYQEAVRLRPGWPEAWINLGNALRKVQRLEPALAAFQRALSLSPDRAKVWWNAGEALSIMGRFDEAIEHYNRSLELDPGFEPALISLGNDLFLTGKRSEGISILRRLVERSPLNAGLHWNLGRLLLAMGEWDEGWEEFEWRLKAPGGRLKREFSQPQWDGSPIAGKTLLLQAEGANGDGIHFARYVPLCIDRGAKVAFECHPALVDLFKQIPGVWKVIAIGTELPEFDLHAPWFSLPRIFRTRVDSVPGSTGYLTAPPDRIEKFGKKVPKDGKLKVGLVWAGSLVFADGRTRTIDVFSSLTTIPGVQFFSLQKGPEATQTPPDGMNLIDLTRDISDFADLAGLLTHLDLLISINTAPVHLAGAMGKPVWMLNPFRSDFRWLLDREDSPWYSSLRIFREPQIGDWRTPLGRIEAELRKLAHQSLR